MISEISKAECDDMIREIYEANIKGLLPINIIQSWLYTLGYQSGAVIEGLTPLEILGLYNTCKAYIIESRRKH